MTRKQGTAPDPRIYAEAVNDFRDLQADNEELREALRQALSPGLHTRRAPRFPTYKARTGAFRRHFVIPDTQVKPGVSVDHLGWAAKYITDHSEPGDVVVHLGDHWDMHSLSTYDKGKRGFEGRRVKLDVDAGNAAFHLLADPLAELPLERHFLFGNHENRIERTLEFEPWLDGVFGLDMLDTCGWTRHGFLDVLSLDGVFYSHYFYNPKTSKPWAGMAATILKNVGNSFVQGHRQGLDGAIQPLPNGRRMRGIVAGSFYSHVEGYIGPQGQSHWRGMLMLTEVADGDFNIVEISLDFLRRRYGRRR